MTINSWQKIDRVIPGRPFGDGIHGDYSSATIPTFVYLSCSGTAASSTLTVSSNTFENGDVIKIHQAVGTGAGQWEINRVASGGGTTTLSLVTPLKYTYTDSGSSQAQAVELFRYKNVTVQSGTWTIPAWNGDIGGLFCFAASIGTTITGNISASSKGFRGGTGGYQDGSPKYPYSGEGSEGQRTTWAGNINYGSGGGIGTNYQGGKGGGGGNGTVGENGWDNFSMPSVPPANEEGEGGDAVGTADLTTMFFGGGGGGSTAGGDSQGGDGGPGGGIIFISSREIEVAGSIVSNGAQGNVRNSTPGGSGAGGSILIRAQSATLGSGLITASGAAKLISGYPADGNYGGGGGAGRIHLDYYSSYTGTTTPTIDASQDGSLVETGGAFLFNMV